MCTTLLKNIKKLNFPHIKSDIAQLLVDIPTKSVSAKGVTLVPPLDYLPQEYDTRWLACVIIVAS